MNYGELIVHDALELGICPGQTEVNLKKPEPSKQINWLKSEFVQITTLNAGRNLEILFQPAEHCLL
jgi:hypothetical protein